MLKQIDHFRWMVRGGLHVNMALSRAAATIALRRIDPTSPVTWEFSGFSQNGEDGVIDVLTSHLRRPNRYFVEIGAADGLENNTTWLAIARRYSGTWIEGNAAESQRCAALFTRLNYGVTCLPVFVTKENANEILGQLLHRDPDVFSLDIDGNDVHLARTLFDAGFRPKICVVEYNSTFGPDRPVTIPYSAGFRIEQSARSNLYYGCSIAGWRAFFEARGYRFVTVEQNGVNGFFVDPDTIDLEWLGRVQGVPFRENFSQLREYRTDWRGQLEQIRDRPLEDVSVS